MGETKGTVGSVSRMRWPFLILFSSIHEHEHRHAFTVSSGSATKKRTQSTRLCLTAAARPVLPHPLTPPGECTPRPPRPLAPPIGARFPRYAPNLVPRFRWVFGALLIMDGS